MLRRPLAIGSALVLTMYLVLSPQGTTEITKHEGSSSKAYLDAVQIPTICVGSTRNVKLGDVATADECAFRLRIDSEVAASAVRSAVHHKLTQEQFDALTSLTFNVGSKALHNSTLVRKANAGDCVGAGAEFNRWVYAKGKKLKGLVVRRASERALWDSGCNLWKS